MEKECPDCGGEGYTETMTWLTYEGDQTWKTERCETCGGSGVIEVDENEEESEDTLDYGETGDELLEGGRK